MKKSKDLNSIQIIQHAPGAPGLIILGMGPKGRLVNGLQKLKELLDEDTSVSYTHLTLPTKA